MELQEPFVLSPVFRTEGSAGEHHHQRIRSLQLREGTAHRPMIRQLVVGKHRTGNDVGSHRRAPSTWRAPAFAACTTSSFRSTVVAMGMLAACSGLVCVLVTVFSFARLSDK